MSAVDDERLTDHSRNLCMDGEVLLSVTFLLGMVEYKCTGYDLGSEMVGTEIILS